MGSSQDNCVMISQEQLSNSLASGKHWIAIDGSVYDISCWCQAHPGGKLVLLHSAGRDVSEAFEAYHPHWVRQQLAAFKVGQLDSEPLHSYPATADQHPSRLPQCASPASQDNEPFHDVPSASSSPNAHDRKAGVQMIDREAQQSRQPKLTAADRLKSVQNALLAQGLFHTSTAFYIRLAACCAACLAWSIWCILQQHVVPGALLLGLFWQQVAFVGHDAGHNAVTHSSKYDGYIGLVVNACIGIGPSWWKATHNVHHLVVNSLDCDPDIQFMPLLAISPRFFKPVFSRYHNAVLHFDAAASRLIPYQHFTFIPLLMVAKYGLYLQSMKQLMQGRCYINRPWETCTQIVFFAWNGVLLGCVQGWVPRLQLLLISHAAFFVLHLQICLSHFSQPTFEGLPEEDQDWVTTQVSGTMNWSCPVWLDWFHGGLQFQIEHHLFPALPRHNLRKASLLVQPLCRDLGLHYHSPSFFGVSSSSSLL
ncbi:TPA: hypothetical protein ACH3X2_004984 [Trebouxia sp. C0005]